MPQDGTDWFRGPWSRPAPQPGRALPWPQVRSGLLRAFLQTSCWPAALSCSWAVLMCFVWSCRYEMLRLRDSDIELLDLDRFDFPMLYAMAVCLLKPEPNHANRIWSPGYLNPPRADICYLLLSGVSSYQKAECHGRGILTELSWTGHWVGSCSSAIHSVPLRLPLYGPLPAPCASVAASLQVPSFHHWWAQHSCSLHYGS